MRCPRPLRTLLLLLVGCHAGPALVGTGPAELSASPASLTLPSTALGSHSERSIAVLNRGGTEAVVEVSTTGPFSTASVTRLTVGPASEVELRVIFAPLLVGAATGTLTLGSLEVNLQGEGLEPPACAPVAACRAAHFDPSSGACVEQLRPDGEVCETTCLVGRCSGGDCLGSPRSCPGGNACTVPVCQDDVGCGQVPRACPQPDNPCLRASCDPSSGCGGEPVPDGTICGTDDCVSLSLQVCLSGQCVTQARPAESRCANRWLSTQLIGRSGAAMAYDEVRKRLVLFGGDGTYAKVNAETWEWDGVRWSRRNPAVSPPGRSGHSMVWDSGRQRVVLFGGNDDQTSMEWRSFADTWEWDGTSWVDRTTAGAPPARFDHSLSYDAVRQRTVLFGGHTVTNALADTWEWDGAVWTERTPAHSPPPRFQHSTTFDLARKKVVLFGGTDGLTSGEIFGDTWEYDGASWVQRAPLRSPPARMGHGLAYDPLRHRSVLFAGSKGGALDDTWEWDGTEWTQVASGAAPNARVGQAFAWDGAERRVIAFGGETPRDRTLAWDGQHWEPRSLIVQPRARWGYATAWDAARGRLVLFGGYDGVLAQGDTWTWDGASWTLEAPARSPAARFDHRMVWDETRQRIVLFGGSAQTPNLLPLGDTWEWDGSTWFPRAPDTSPPPRSGHTMAYDGIRGRVLVGGGIATDPSDPFTDLWEWDGTRWTPGVAPTSEAFRYELAWDPRRGRVIFAGGPISFGRSQTVTMEWDGTRWTEVDRRDRPPDLAVFLSGANPFALAYDAALDGVVAVQSDTWAWNATTWLRLPSPTPSPLFANGTMAYDPVRQHLLLIDWQDLWVFVHE